MSSTKRTIMCRQYSKSRKKSKADRKQAAPSTDHIEAFFTKHPDFDYDLSAPIWTEFSHMYKYFEWNDEDYEMQETRRNLKAAMVKQFNNLDRTDVEDLNS
ncbi:hypothetical protein QBC46DRAFT_453763 [Diplogelasinospora grovesii]|uniref:Uncharacterized protein n=1 Tax=Diplogelasinospora grovesii TaxID=303347 RepID=A0AAN6S013_9PEZI|nr:hypothetical protein QBC46DRAFT_453763 [Diplogelasinospora grovesii]